MKSTLMWWTRELPSRLSGPPCYLNVWYLSHIDWPLGPYFMIYLFFIIVSRHVARKYQKNRFQKKLSCYFFNFILLKILHKIIYTNNETCFDSDVFSLNLLFGRPAQISNWDPVTENPGYVLDKKYHHRLIEYLPQGRNTITGWF